MLNSIKFKQLLYVKLRRNSTDRLLTETSDDLTTKVKEMNNAVLSALLASRQDLHTSQFQMNQGLPSSQANLRAISLLLEGQRRQQEQQMLRGQALSASVPLPGTITTGVPNPELILRIIQQKQIESALMANVRVPTQQFIPQPASLGVTLPLAQNISVAPNCQSSMLTKATNIAVSSTEEAASMPMTLTHRSGTFPQKLHRILHDLSVQAGGNAIASWQEGGTSFIIHSPRAFCNHIMPRYFRMSRFSSFQRQLNLYEFSRITEGPKKGSYYHKLFVQSRPSLCTLMRRTKIKGVKMALKGADTASSPSPTSLDSYDSPSVNTKEVEDDAAAITVAPKTGAAVDEKKADCNAENADI